MLLLLILFTPSNNEIEGIRNRSSFRIRYDEEYASGMCINPFLIQLRLYEIRHESGPYLPICM